MGNNMVCAKLLMHIANCDGDVIHTAYPNAMALHVCNLVLTNIGVNDVGHVQGV